jgi:hypothetical protein
MIEKIKSFFGFKVEEEKIKEIVCLEAKRYLEAYITDVNDLKTEYLKRYLEARTDSGHVFVNSLASRIDFLQNKMIEMNDKLESLTEEEN